MAAGYRSWAQRQLGGGGAKKTLGPVAHRNYTYANWSGRTVTTFMPSPGMVDGDIMILFFITGQGGTVPPPTANLPPGFSPLLFESIIGLASFTAARYVAYKVASGETGGSYQVTLGVADPVAYLTTGFLVCVSGGDTSHLPPPFSGADGFGMTSTAPAATSPAAGSLSVFLDHCWNYYGTVSPPTGYTERADPGDSLIYFADMTVGAGSTGDVSHANTNSPGWPWGSYLVIIPAVGAAPPDYTARNKRASTLGIDGLYRMVLPVPDGGITTTDRWQITGKYSMTGAPPAARIFRNRTASRMRPYTLPC